MKLAAIILNFRTPDLTLGCLASLVPQLRAMTGGRAIVLDNGSGDRSESLLRQAVCDRGWRDVVTVLASKANLGFAAGNNFACRRAAAAEYLLLLNSDTVVNPGCLSHCMGQMDKSPSIGALSCRLNHPDGTPQTTARRFPTPLGEMLAAFHLPLRLPRVFGWADTQDPGWDRAVTIRDVEWISGAFMLLRGSLVRTIGLFDEDFFFYGEDLELCHRIRRAGRRIRYDPTVSAVHLVGGSSGPENIDPARREGLLRESRYLVLRKLRGPFGAGAVRLGDALASRLRKRFRRPGKSICEKNA